MLTEEELDKRLLEAERTLASIRPRPLPTVVRESMNAAKASAAAKKAPREFIAAGIRGTRELREKRMTWKD